MTSTLTQGQQARSARLFALLKVAFASHVRIDSLIRAYEAGCAIHNSPTKPFGSCGYELLRILALEFSLRTRTEAICLRSELLKRDVKVDSKSVHAMSDLIRGIQVAVNRYDRLVETLPPDISRADLLVTPSDMSLMFIRNMPHDAKQYCLLHSENESWEALQLSALKYERQQRLYVELGAMSKRFINETREVADHGFDETDYVDDGQVSVLKQGCGRCGKKTHETKDCDTNLANTKCFKCGKTGHIGRNCRMGKPVDGDKGGNAKGKTKGKPKGKAKASPKSKGKGGGKGKMFEVGGEETWEEVEGGHEEPSGSGDAPEGGLQMALFSFYPEDPQSEVVLSNSRVGIDCGDDEICVSPHPHVSGDEETCCIDPHSHVVGHDDICADPHSHTQNSCSPLLSSTGVFGGNHENNWWLVDSGASVTVLSEQTLKQSCYEILNEETVTNGPRYFAANGTAVVMKRRVTLKAFVSLMENGQLEGCSIELTALVGETCNNILSTSQLVEKGWKVEMSGRACTLTHEASGRYSELVSWGGCPWIFLGALGMIVLPHKWLLVWMGSQSIHGNLCTRVLWFRKKWMHCIGPGVTSLMIQTVPFVRGQSR